MAEFNKKTGYKMADRPTGYRGEKFSKVCFQRKLRDSYAVEKTLDLSDPVLKEISFQKAQEFILKYEWLGTMGTTKFSLGLFIEENLVGVLCFGLTAGTNSLSEPFGENNKSKGLVLVRGACSPEAHAHTASYMIGKSKEFLLKKGYNF